METRSLTQIGLLQVGIVLGGYLLAAACIKVGYGAAAELGLTSSTWSVNFIREHGLLPLALPLLWICGALLLHAKCDQPIFSRTLPVCIGAALVVGLLFGYALAAVEGISGPPQPSFIYMVTSQK